jgi:DNA-binding MarR family transcriptional regulator
MKFENTIIYQFLQLATAHRSLLQKALNEFDLNSGQIFILISLWKTDGQSQVSLARNLSLTPPTINKMVKSLIAGGFIVSQKCESDSRIMQIYLTEKGRQIRPSVEELWLRIQTEFFSSLTDTEKLMQLQLFEKLSAHALKKVAPASEDL